MRSKVKGFFRRIHPSLCAMAHRRRLIYNPVPPFDVFIELTAFCNLRCPTCPHSGGLNRPKGNMDFELYKKIIRQARSWASQVSLFLAGEPLFYPHLSEALKLAQEAGLYTRIHTNGLLLNEERTNILLSGHLDELSISLDGPTEEHYDKIRVGGDFKDCVAKVKNFMETRSKRGLTKPRLIVQSLCLKGEDEGALLEGSKELLKGYSYDSIKIIPAHSFAGFYKDHIRNPAVAEPIYSGCAMLYNRFTVLWDGRTTACCNDFEACYITGDLRKASLRTIWNDKPFQTIRRLLRDGEYSKLKLCRDCDVIWGGNNRRKGVPLVGYALSFVARVLERTCR
jgi:MoaA/NifB/PqqE/SkfB family radical SAM enzyme